MNVKLKHRGPDYAGVFSDHSIDMGHLLLAIRDDAENSKQPYVRNGSPWVLLFNGQIYNTEQLKKELPNEYKDSDLDTAILYGMIEKYGWDFVSKVHGMFAIALYNKNEEVVKLYRDSSGQKVLYYYHKEKEFIFSSEIRGILTHNTVDREVDLEAVTIATALGFIPGVKTLFKHIKKVNLSQTISYDIKTNKLQTEHYISNTPEHYFENSMDSALNQLVSEHLQSKQNVAINLSGGLDSSLLAHEISKIGHKVHSYTTRFDVGDEKYNKDADLAKRLAKDYGLTHTEILITKEDYIQNFTESYQIIEEPRHNISIPTYYITAKKEGIYGDKNRVVLSGDGGDEIFGGYHHYRRNIRDDIVMKKYTPFIFSVIRNIRNKTPMLDFRNPIDRWYYYRYFKYTKLSFLKNAPPLSTVPSYLRRAGEHFFDSYTLKEDSVYGGMLVDRAIWLAGENFIRTDKLYMNQSIEMRSPFAYQPFRVFTDTLLKRGDYISENNNKLFMRQFAENKLPAYITKRPDKTGWRAPADIWYDGKTKSMFLDIVSNAEKNSLGIIDWKSAKTSLEKNPKCPNRQVRLLVSLAALAENLNIHL